MRSRTSYFNRTLFLKTVTRFWPLWFIYFAVWFVAMPLVISSNLRWGLSLLNMQGDICTGATLIGIIVSFFSACVAAMAVWSFMYSARSTSGMASLPLRRECVFVSVSLGGIVPLLCVNVLIVLLCLGIQGLYGVVDAGILGQWLAAVSLELVFYYGFALVCAQLTGNLAVLPLVYLALNFAVYVVMQIISTLMSKFVYGAYGGVWSDAIMTLTPVLWMYMHFTVNSERVLDPDGDYKVVSYYLSGWGTLLAYAAVGLVLCALALWLYRRRRMESAGDVVAVSILKPVFKYCMTFGCALCVGSVLYDVSGGIGFGDAVNNLFFGSMSLGGSGGVQWGALALMTVYMLIGAFIGYFASEMLIHKSFRVWRGHWLGLGVSALVVVALMLSMELDLFGYERRVPNPDSVESVSISTTQYYTTSSWGYDSRGGVTLREPENIAAAVELHRSVVGNKAWYEGFDEWGRNHDTYDSEELARSICLSIDYELKSGRHITRSYNSIGYFLSDPSTQTDARAAQNLLNTPEAITERKATAFEYTAETIFDARVNCAILPRDVEKAVETGDVYDDNGEKIGAKNNYAAMFGGAEAEEEYGRIIEYSAEWSFTPKQAAELYNECILPDMAEGTIGTVWIIPDAEYENTVYDAKISMHARMLHKDETLYFGPMPDYRYEYFYTVPTVNSVRTNRWLEEHGVILRTIAETGHN